LVGELDGESVRRVVGNAEGSSVGELDGENVGRVVGTAEGSLIGVLEGSLIGAMLETMDGEIESTVGSTLGDVFMTEANWRSIAFEETRSSSLRPVPIEG